MATQCQRHKNILRHAAVPHLHSLFVRWRQKTDAGFNTKYLGLTWQLLEKTSSGWRWWKPPPCPHQLSLFKWASFPRSAARTDSLAASQWFRFCWFNCLLRCFMPHVCQATSATAGIPFHLGGETWGSSGAQTGHLPAVGGRVWAPTIEEQWEPAYWPFKEIKQWDSALWPRDRLTPTTPGYTYPG